MDNFKDAPVSVSELRANRDRDGRLWGPRDALISVLRDIDNDIIKPDTLIIAYRDIEADGTKSFNFTNASSDHLLSIGLLERAKLVLCRCAE